MMLVLAAAVVLGCGTGVPAAACSPCPNLSDAERERRAEAIVEGVVTDLDGPGWFRPGWVATVRVDRVLKGRPATTLRLDTVGPNPICGLALEEGYRYRLYLTRIGGTLVPAFCGGSSGLSDGPVLPWWRIHDEWLAAAGGFLLSNALAYALLRSLRRRRTRAPRTAGRTPPARSAPSM